MNPHDRRLGDRVPLDMLMTEYMNDRPHRALTVNISQSGIFVNKMISPFARRTRVVGLEFELPGTGDVIWARGEICHDDLSDCFHGEGIRFTAMPRVYARLIRDFCHERRRAQLGRILDRIRRARQA
jgi:hypothetical protein